MKKVLFVIFLLILGMGSCTVYELYKATHPYTEKEEQEIKEKASKAAIEYFKVKENLDIVVTKVEFSNDISGSWINVDGYVSGDKKKEVSANVDYKNDYNVTSYNY
ncbi:hypothetical protein COE15_02285 [Bacillus cereus]|uniref:hypothetical protein n=1 Tax=unclassified Bacillus (in: firmicutes) TaxID=185979 RepID=UPI0008983756|nr:MULTISPECIES: hypothetical protein [unclassified Bacillus (in: firmicutes)]PFE06017.1 hypothetical protein CN288_04565 [Bacillus sp. AFS023182]PGY04114.1 hypothetical protein COE15_02285 [Bacillus cereus]SDY39471.1 hypothetical protein SAMN04488156_101182 [Bacillus sp. 166amftsu]